MKILILNQFCFPEPDFKTLIFAKELEKYGHTVQILTGFPNYPGGKIYKGYKVKFWQKDVIDGIEILRVPLFPDHSNSSFKRVLSYLSFAFSASIIGVFWVRRADVLYVYHPPLTIAIPALIIKFFRRIPIVYDIQDLWPDTLSSTGMISKTFILTCINKVCNVVYKMADHIVVLSPGFKDILISRKVPENKISVIYNWSPLTEIPIKVNKNCLPNSEKITFLFAGSMGKAQGLITILKAAEIIMKMKLDQIQFVFIGGGISKNSLIEHKFKMGLTNVIFLDRVSSEQIVNYLVAADILMVHLMDDQLFKITIPSKTQVYLQVGKPILMAVGGNAEELIKKANAGVCCPPSNVDEMVKAILTFYHLDDNYRSMLGNNGRIFYEQNFTIKVGTEKFIEIFKKTSYSYKQKCK